MNEIDTMSFLDEEKVRELVKVHTTPFYVYSRRAFVMQAEKITNAFKDVPFGLTVRYAMKANPNQEVLKIFDSVGLHVDASSEYEAAEAIEAGIDPSKILLTSQQLPKDIKKTVKTGIHFTATSLHQLEEYGKPFPGTEVSVRLNTGLGSGMVHRLTTGGVEVGFGIWYHKGDTRSDEIHEIIEKYDLKVVRVHIHIGTGSDPSVWGKLMDAGLMAAKDFENTTTLNLGGGFKIAYMKGDKAADIDAIGSIAKEKLQEFYEDTGRKLTFEVEPGRFLTAQAGVIVSTIIDRTDTGDNGDDFLKLDTGMTEFIRTGMYGSQHPLVVVPKQQDPNRKNHSYVVVGHCCESSDVFTTVSGDPEQIEPRTMLEASIDDYMIVEKTGAYCAGFSTKGYNSFPVAEEILID